MTADDAQQFGLIDSVVEKRPTPESDVKPRAAAKTVCELQSHLPGRRKNLIESNAQALID